MINWNDRWSIWPTVIWIKRSDFRSGNTHTHALCAWICWLMNCIGRSVTVTSCKLDTISKLVVFDRFSLNIGIELCGVLYAIYSKKCLNEFMCVPFWMIVASRSNPTTQHFRDLPHITLPHMVILSHLIKSIRVQHVTYCFVCFSRRSVTFSNRKASNLDFVCNNGWLHVLNVRIELVASEPVWMSCIA